MPNHGMGPKRRRRIKNALRRRDGNRCQDCQAPFTEQVPPTIEHRLLLRRGGTNARTNLELLCAPCNRERNRLDLEAA